MHAVTVAAWYKYHYKLSIRYVIVHFNLLLYTMLRISQLSTDHASIIVVPMFIIADYSPSTSYTYFNMAKTIVYSGSSNHTMLTLICIYNKIQKHFQNVMLVGMANEISKNYTYKCVDRSTHNGIKGAKAKCAN